MGTTKTGLVPDEDTGTIFACISTAPGTSQERTAEVVNGRGGRLHGFGRCAAAFPAADIDDIGSMIGIYRLVKIAYSPDAQDTLPAMMLLEYLNPVHEAKSSIAVS